MAAISFEAWQQVPQRVAELTTAAAALRYAHTKAAAADAAFSCSTVTWQPETNNLVVYCPAAISAAAADTYAAALAPTTVTIKNAAAVAIDPEHEILLKRAAIPLLGSAVDVTQKALGGPNPLTNTIVASLLAGGLGYGAGTLVENLFPERYIERGQLRKNLGLMGVLGGVGLGAANAWSNARGSMSTDAFYSAPLRNFFRGYLMRNNRTPPGANSWAEPHKINDLPQQLLNRQSILPDAAPAADDRVAKIAAFGPPGFQPHFNNSSLMTPMIPVQQFNQSVWQDAQRGMRHGFQQHTPPAYAAATTGMLSGLSAGTQSPIIRPVDVINGIASAGVGLATANIAGRALSALAGLTPAGQEKLQDLGLFGGMMHAIAPAILGLR
jgi:hypothetical protein